LNVNVPIPTAPAAACALSGDYLFTPAEKFQQKFRHPR
jgi:hypothetical protein